MQKGAWDGGGRVAGGVADRAEHWLPSHHSGTHGCEACLPHRDKGAHCMSQPARPVLQAGQTAKWGSRADQASGSRVPPGC